MDHPEDHSAFGGRSIRDVILGANDGFVSILGLVSGVAGGTANNSLVVLAGVAGAIAAAISMALGNYISIKSQIEVYKAEIERERREIEEMPAAEKQEVREMYAKKGFRGKELELVVKRLTTDKKVWLKVMMEEELGLREGDLGRPKLSAALTGGAFIVASVFPIVPYVFFPVQQALLHSVALTMLAVFVVGAAKTFFTKRPWLRSGLEMAVIAALSSAIAYVVGQAIGVTIS